jgi:hypothetical protein
MKNWRTSISGFLTAACLYIYQDPSALQAIPEPYRTGVYKLIGFLIFAGIISMGACSKDSAPNPPAP